MVIELVIHIDTPSFAWQNTSTEAPTDILIDSSMNPIE